MLAAFPNIWSLELCLDNYDLHMKALAPQSCRMSDKIDTTVYLSIVIRHNILEFNIRLQTLNKSIRELSIH